MGSLISIRVARSSCGLRSAKRLLSSSVRRGQMGDVASLETRGGTANRTAVGGMTLPWWGSQWHCGGVNTAVHGYAAAGEKEYSRKVAAIAGAISPLEPANWA